MFTYGEISEIFYDNCKFPLNKDHDGNVWHLISTADHLIRSKALYHPTVISKKQDLILVCMEAKNQKQGKHLDDAKGIL